MFISMTGIKMAQCIRVVSILLHEAKAVLGLLCLHLNTVGWSGHVQGCSAKKEVWERRKATPIVRIKWAFACKNFYTGSSYFTIDFWLAVQICLSLAHLWDRRMCWCNHLDLISSSTINSAKSYGNLFPLQKNVWERRSHPTTTLVVWQIAYNMQRQLVGI